MTLNNIILKMLLVNFRRYRLYFLCNVFSVVLFYCFAAIFTNKTFMNIRVVDSIISSNIYAPSVIVAIFLILFVPYSNSVFLKNRKFEYGVLMTLGMSETEVWSNMLFESSVVASLSLVGGLVLGTIISLIFYAIIHQVIGVSGLQWYFNLDSYKWTAILYGVTIVLTLVIGILGFAKAQVIDLLKEKFRAENKGKPLPGLFVTGMVLVIVSVLIMVWGYEYGTTDMWFVGLALMFAGLYMIISQLECCEQFLTKMFPEYGKQHLLEISFLRQHRKSRSTISTIATWLLGLSVFFAGLCMVSYPFLIDNAINNSPYDLVYSQIFGKNQVKDLEIERLLNQNGVSVKTVKQVNYLRGSAFNLLPVSEVNKKFNCNYKISKGKFLMVFQYDLKSDHKTSVPQTISFNCGDDNTITLRPAGSDKRILFNRNPTFADRTLILNDTDYHEIASKSHDYWTGVMKLYSFDGWRESLRGIDAVQNYLLEKNQVGSSRQIYYKATSRIETYTTSKQSAEFLIFLISFIAVLFCMASDIMIHFNIKAEAEEEQRMLSGLYRIGVTAEEMVKIIQHKNMYYYMPPVITGIFIGIFYNYTVPNFYGYGGKAAGYSLLFGVVLLVFQLAMVIRYSRKEFLGFGI